MVSNIDLSKEECLRSNILTNDFDFFQHDILIDISAFLHYFCYQRKVVTMKTKPTVTFNWNIVGFSFITLALAYGIWYSFSVYFVALLKEFQWIG